LQEYEGEQSFFVENDLKQGKRKPLLVGADIIEKPTFSKKKMSKQQLLRHDEEKLASVLMGLVS